jgi:hypothetical protein
VARRRAVVRAAAARVAALQAQAPAPRRRSPTPHAETACLWMRGAHATEWRLPGGGSTAGLGAPQGRRRHRNGHRDATMVLLARTSVRRDSANDIGGGQYLRDLPSSRMADRETMLPPQQEACILTVSLRTEVSVSGKPNFVRGDKGDKHRQKIHRDAGRDGAHAQQVGRLGGNYRMAGKSPRKSGCVVADAVTVEPVSAEKFPWYQGKIQGKNWWRH